MYSLAKMRINCDHTGNPMSGWTVHLQPLGKEEG